MRPFKESYIKTKAWNKAIKKAADESVKASEAKKRSSDKTNK